MFKLVLGLGLRLGFYCFDFRNFVGRPRMSKCARFVEGSGFRVWVEILLGPRGLNGGLGLMVLMFRA